MFESSSVTDCQETMYISKLVLEVGEPLPVDRDSFTWQDYRFNLPESQNSYKFLFFENDKTTKTE